jgi:anti-anti-sigma factor
MAHGSRQNHRATAGTGAQATVVTLPAEIDISNDVVLQTALVSAFAAGRPVVIADGTGTHFCDCRAIAALIRAHHQATLAGAQLRLVVASPMVSRALEVTGADQVLAIYPSLADACQNLPASPVPTAATAAEAHQGGAEIRDGHRHGKACQDTAAVAADHDLDD